MGAQMDAFEARNGRQDVNEVDGIYPFREQVARTASWELTNSRNTRNYDQGQYKSNYDDQPVEPVRTEQNYEPTKSNQELFLSPAAKGPLRPRLPEDWYTGYTKERYRNSERNRNSLDDEGSEDYEDERELHQIRQDVRSPPVRERGLRYKEFNNMDDDFVDDANKWSLREKKAQLYRTPLTSNERPITHFINGAPEEETYIFRTQFPDGKGTNNFHFQEQTNNRFNRERNFKNGASEDEEYFDGNKFPDEKDTNSFWPRAQADNRFNTERAQKRVASPRPQQIFDDQFHDENRANVHPSRLNNRTNVQPSRTNNRFATERPRRFDAVREPTNFKDGRFPEEQWPFRKAPKPVPDFVERFAMDAAQRNGVTQTFDQDFSPQDPKTKKSVSIQHSPTVFGEQLAVKSIMAQRKTPRIALPNTAQRTSGTQTIFRNQNFNAKHQETLPCGQHNLDKGCVNIGFVGGPKTGKSTLIDALRGLSKSDMGSAVPKPARTHRRVQPPQITPYTCTMEKMENSVLWEIPLQIPMNGEQFIQENSLHEFDVIFLIIAGAISKDEILFATTINACQTPFAFVLSGCDSDMKLQEAESDLQPFGRFKARFEQKARSVFNSGIEDIAPGLSAIPVYFISAPVIKNRLRRGDDHEVPALTEKYAIDEDIVLDVLHEVCQLRR